VDRGDHIYAVRAVERMTGLPVTTIRQWIQETIPAGGGQDETRLFSRDEVEALIAWATGAPSPGPDAVPELSERAQSGAESDTSTRLLILLAERDEYAASLTEYFLRTEGYRVETVFTQEDATARYTALQPDIAIVELFMSGGAGFELATELAVNGSCPVIVVSALDAATHPASAHAAAVLKKPLDPLKLISTVRDLLGTSSLVRGAAPHPGPSVADGSGGS
jgi:CheY-like chemotaxis protein